LGLVAVSNIPKKETIIDQNKGEQTNMQNLFNLAILPIFGPQSSSSEKTWGTSTMKTRHGYLSKRWYSAVHPKTTEDLVFLWALTHPTIHGLPVLLLKVGNRTTNNVAFNQHISGF